MGTAQTQSRAQPFSVRLAESTSLLVAEEARASGRSRNAVIEELTNEAAKMRLFPGVAFRGRPRRAWVIGTGLDVWEVIEMIGSYKSDLRRLRRNHPRVTERAARIAQAYKARFPDEIEEFLAGNRRPLEELRELYPFIEF